MDENNTYSPLGGILDSDHSIRHFSGKSYWDFIKEGSSPMVYCIITIDGKEFTRSCCVEITQHTNDHDSFILTTPDDSFDSFKGYVMENSKYLTGQKVEISFWRFKEKRQSFLGIIAKIENRKHDGGGYGDLIITGYAPSIYLESGKDCRSFEDKTLEQIIAEVCSGYTQAANIITKGLNTDYILPYTVQYKESDYQFIKRLAVLHGEYFYYNGENLVFGNSVQPMIDLEENIDLINIQFELNVKPQEFSYTSYDTDFGKAVSKDTSQIKSYIQYKENPFQAILINSSQSIFKKKPKMHFNHSGISKRSDTELKEAVRREKENRENLIYVRGKSKDPELKIGGRAKIIDINCKPMETYRIIEIRHYHDGNTYYNEFTGIPDLYNAPYQDNEAVPLGEIQAARVVDNNDPWGAGRIRVQFPWQMDKNEKTPWLQLILPHAGAGKGFNFIPEIGEEVMINYECGNADKPFVMGNTYNGNEKSGYHTAGNDIKAIRTRSGIENISNDAEGSWKQSTPDGNFLKFDGKGNAMLNVPNDLTINVGKNFNINVGENISFMVGLKAIYNIGVQMMMNAPILKYFISNNYHLQSPKTLINGEGEIKIEAKETNVSGSQKLFMHSEETAMLNSKGVVAVKGQEGTHHDNKPEDYDPEKPEITAKCIVHFRPRKDWEGKGYGFDYFRTGDTSILNGGTAFFMDQNYENMVAKQYEEATHTTLVTNVNEFNKYYKADPKQCNELKKDYDVHNIPWKIKKDAKGKPMKDSKGNAVPEEYFCSWLSLYPNGLSDDNVGKQVMGVPLPLAKPNTEALLSLIVDIEEEADVLRFEDNEHFMISPKEIDIKGKKKGKYPFADAITVRCLKEFSADQTIIINAIKKSPDGKEESLPAGKLKVMANDASKRKKVKILLVSVTTDISASGSQVSGEITDKSNFLKQYLRQALIEAEIEIEKLNLSLEPELQSGGAYVKSPGILGANYKQNPPSGFWNLEYFAYRKLREQLRAVNPADENKYKDHYKIFYYGERGGSYTASGKVGAVSGYANNDLINIFAESKDQTSTHELLHSLGMPHSFSNKECTGYEGTIFTYFPQSTDNIMDYSVTRYALWHWQWIKANNKIKTTV